MPYKDKKDSLKAVKKHYESHKDEVLKKRVIARILDGKVPQMASLTKFDITESMVNEMRAEVDLAPIKIKPTQKKKEKIKIKIDLQFIHDHYNKMAEDKVLSESTANGYYTVFKRVMSDSGCTEDQDLIGCLKTKDIIEFLQKRYKSNPNTLHTYLTAILSVIDTIPAIKKEVDRDAYKEAWDTAKQEKETFNIQRGLSDKVERFSAIKDRIEKKFSETSDESLMVNLYNQLTVRNDYDDLSFDTGDPNHIDLDEGTITLRKFKKTDKKYKPIINYKLSDQFVSDLKKSLKVKPRTKVFIKTMKSIFKKAGTGVNELRHSKISEELEGSNLKDQSKREDLRERMLHSSATQLQYLRELKD